jgi:glutathione peroxidase
MANSVYDFTVKNIAGKEVNLADYQGKTLILVNVASQCGLTPQYADLQAFYESYKDKGVEILGFPANNFGAQEPGTDAEIQTFCTTNYGVTFPMFSKISVKGEDQHPLYQYLTQQAQTDVTWNFQKFIVDKTGQVVQTFAPQTSVDEPEFRQAIERML